jgi:hypothetical protein
MVTLAFSTRPSRCAANVLDGFAASGSRKTGQRSSDVGGLDAAATDFA